MTGRAAQPGGAVSVLASTWAWRPVRCAVMTGTWPASWPASAAGPVSARCESSRLSIVAAIAEAHGGTLDLYARPEGGLRVSIGLPLARTAVPA